MIGSDKRTRWYNNHDEENDDADNDTDAHLHVFPPHLLPDSVGTPSETLSGDGQVVGLILECIETFATLRHFVDVLFH